MYDQEEEDARTRRINFSQPRKIYIAEKEEGAKARKNRGLFKNYLSAESVCATMMMRNTWIGWSVSVSSRRDCPGRNCESPGGVDA